MGHFGHFSLRVDPKFGLSRVELSGKGQFGRFQCEQVWVRNLWDQVGLKLKVDLLEGETYFSKTVDGIAFLESFYIYLSMFEFFVKSFLINVRLY